MAHTLGEIAKYIDAELWGDAGTQIDGVATLENAKSGDISFLSNRKYYRLLKLTKASAVIVKREDYEQCPAQALVVDNPYTSYTNVMYLFYPAVALTPGIHPTAVVSQTAEISSSAQIGPQVVIEDHATVGPNCFIGPASVIGAKVEIGKNAHLHANVVLSNGAKIGDNAFFHPGVVIGGDGFGMANDRGKWIKIPHIGKVVIGNDVEIGANTSVDRGSLEDTVIEDGVKIDNQVQIGHNVHIGANTVIAGCAGIAGSVRIGKRCMIGGAAGIAGHLEITDDVTIIAKSNVARSVRQAGVYASSIPITEAKAWWKIVAGVKRIGELALRVNKLEVEQTNPGKNK